MRKNILGINFLEPSIGGIKFHLINFRCKHRGIKPFWTIASRLIVILVFVISCGKSQKPAFKVTEEPSEKLIKQLGPTHYSIVLNDMTVAEENEKMVFKHKYHVLKNINDNITVDSLDWQPVNEKFFVKHENDLGMEIVSNHNDRLSRVAQPVGFGWAIGNDKYGSWEEEKTDSTKTTNNSNNNNRRVWRSHGPSMLMMYMLMRRPTYQRNYNSYQSAHASGRSYYGKENNTYTHGTRSSYQKTRRPSFYSRMKSNPSWKRFTSRNSRSSSRYNNGSKTRSRSGGFGK